MVSHALESRASSPAPPRIDEDRPLPTTTHGRRTRQRLIEAALDEFREVGHVAARVEAITDRAGLGYGTFYNYFSSKLDLISAVADDVYGELYDFIARPPANSSSVRQRMLDNILAYFRICYRHRDELLVLDDVVGSDPAIAKRIDAFRVHYAEAWSSKMTQGLGYHPVADAATVGAITSSLGHEIVRQYIRSDECTGDPEVDAPALERLARIAALMTMAAVDPVSLGIDNEALMEIMEQLVPSQ